MTVAPRASVPSTIHSMARASNFSFKPCCAFCTVVTRQVLDPPTHAQNPWIGSSIRPTAVHSPGHHSPASRCDVRINAIYGLVQQRDSLQTVEELFASILTCAPMGSTMTGRTFLSIVGDSILRPDVYGNWEPLRARFDPRLVEEALDAWSFPFLWQRTKGTRGSGGLWITQGVSQTLQHSAINLRLADSKDWSQLAALVRAVSLTFTADFAFLEPFSDRCIQLGRQNETVHALNKKGTQWTMSVTSHHIKKYLPDAYWAMILGRPYVDLFGLDRILTAPALVVEQLSDEMAYLQLSEDASDVVNKAGMVDDVRSKVKEHLGFGAFFQNGVDDYQVPRFAFPAR